MDLRPGVAVEVVEVDGYRLAYRSVGDGPPLVLLHGAWSDGREWRVHLESLSDEFRVIAWDAPGCGASADPPDDFGLAGYADAAAGLVDALGAGRVHVLGLSFGGGLAIELYRRHPEIVRSLILVSAYAGWAGSLPPDVVQARVRRALAEADQPPETWVDGYMDGFFAREVPQPLVDEMRAIMCDVRRAGIVPMVRAFAAADLRDVLPTIGVPTLLVYGERDERSPLAVARDLHARIPRAELVVIPHAGHVLNVEAPDELDAAVRDFLRSVDV